MKTERVFKILLTWLPSILISVLFIHNAIDKIIHSDQLDKVIANSKVIAMVGFILLISTALFLYDKTIVFGATMLTIYMTCIVCIHLFKGKPFELAMLIVVSIVFATYLRKPQIFNRGKEGLE